MTAPILALDARPKPAFGPREQKIYRYGILHTVLLRRQGDQKMPPMSEDDLREMCEIEKELEMLPAEIVSADFAQSFGDKCVPDIGAA